MLRLSLAVRSGAARAVHTTLRTVAGGAHPVAASRPLSSSALAAAKAVVPGGKKKIRQGYGNKKSSGAPGEAKKPKKAGMTHLKFRDAVRQLGFEKNAPPLQAANGNNPLVLGALSPAALAAAAEGAASPIVRYAPDALAKLGALQSFKKFQHHEMFNEPVSMITDNTRALYDAVVRPLVGADGASDGASTASSANRICLLGDKGTGKSTLLAQVQALATAQQLSTETAPECLLLHVDHPEKIIDGTSDYIYNAKLGKYQQPMFTKRWIIKLREANAPVLKRLPLSQDVSFVNKKKQEVHLKQGEHTVYDFLEQNHDFGKVGPTSAFQTLVAELQHHSQNGVAVLVTVDNANAIINAPVSKYHHPDYTPIHVRDFEVGAFLLSLLSGDVSFARGAVVVAESSDSNTAAHTLDVGLGLEEYDPYYTPAECDHDLAAALLANGGVRSYQLANLSKDQTRDIMEFWDAAGVLQLRDYPRKEKLADGDAAANAAAADPLDPAAAELVFDKLVQNSYTLTSGNIGGLVKVTNFLY